MRNLNFLLLPAFLGAMAFAGLTPLATPASAHMYDPHPVTGPLPTSGWKTPGWNTGRPHMPVRIWWNWPQPHPVVQPCNPPPIVPPCKPSGGSGPDNGGNPYRGDGGGNGPAGNGHDHPPSPGNGPHWGNNGGNSSPVTNHPPHGRW